MKHNLITKDIKSSNDVASLNDVDWLTVAFLLDILDLSNENWY